MWCRNNLDTIGKWGRISLLFSLIVTASMLKVNNFAHAYAGETIPTNPHQQTELKLDFNSVGKINEVTAPVNNLINSAVNGLRLNQNINIGTGIPLSPLNNTSQNIDFSKFFSSSKVSSNDITSFLKEASITVINLTILVISITTEILKGLLSVLK